MNFSQKLKSISKKNNSLLCIGLDSELEKIPKHLLKSADPIFDFNKAIIDATFDLVCSYKPNIAFYEANGIDGLKSLKKTIEYLKTNYPQIPIILDCKRADIGNTARMYAKAAFEYWDADGATVYPYLGKDAVLPFLEYKDKCTILIIKTSNPDASMFQDIKIAKEIKKWNFENIGLFVGATYPEELKAVRALFPNSPILTAGIGAQGAETAKAVKAGVDKNGENLICNSSREIIYASSREDFTQAARKEALRLQKLIQEALKNG